MNKDILKEIGLTDYEAKIYLTLLSGGQMSAYKLAEKAGLYRQVVYDSLKRLFEKGFVNSVTDGKSKSFKATNPQLILEFLNEKVDSYQKIIPELMRMDKASRSPLIVETYSGKNVIRISLRDVINSLKNKRGEVLCTAIDETIPDSKNKTILEQYERDIIKYGIKERVIIKEGTRGIFNNGNTKYKKIPQKFFNENPTQIYDDNVQIIVWGNPDYLIIIRNKEVAESYRKQFEFMWSVAKN